MTRTPAVFCTLVLLFSASGIARGSTGPNNRPDPQKALLVTIPRISASTVVDGSLDEDVWEQATRLSGFFQFLPVDGRPSQDSTHVLVWYAPTGIHFGIRAYETHGEVRANLSDRDKIGSDDHIVILLDTFDDQRQVFALAINALGSQADGICRDASRSVNVYTSGNNAPYSIDLNPDYVFQSSGRLTPFGYEVEVFIPFKSLRYQSKDVQSWGFNVIRSVQHSGYLHSWAPILQENNSFLGQSGKLVDLTELKRGLVLDINPEFTNSVSGAREEGAWSYQDPKLEWDDFGGSIRWGVTNNLSLNATLNPDFSQVEADVAQIQWDPRDALFFPEKRPFFLEGIEFFSMPQNLIYSRRLENPTGAMKMAGKIAGTSVGVLSGMDRKSTSITGEDFRYFNAVRVKRDIFSQSTVGIAFTDKTDGMHSNRVASVDGRFVIRNQYAVSFQGSGSFTDSDNGGMDFAPLWYVSASRSGRTFGFTASATGIHDDFNAEMGFIRRTDTAGLNFSPRVTLFPKEGSFIESVTGSLTFDGRWDYDEFVEGKGPNERRFWVNSAFALTGGWSIAASIFKEAFIYPPALFENFYVERAENGVVSDTTEFVGTRKIDVLDFALNLSTPRFDAFSASLFAAVGSDVNFYEWAPADIWLVTFSMNWNPSDQIRMNFLYNLQQVDRPSDGSHVRITRIPRLKMEYQLSQAIFFRLVAQYNSDEYDDLRDDSRTGAPILIRDAQGNYRRTSERHYNDMQVDFLFSYRPSPGTVVFFGYGSSLSEQSAFRFNRFRRQSDGFFLKLSYLFRA